MRQVPIPIGKLLLFNDTSGLGFFRSVRSVSSLLIGDIAHISRKKITMRPSFGTILPLNFSSSGIEWQ